uniref:Maturation n=1 Tax=Leviviridae sp. TaxID=2027243 RepID=A0A514DC84_9VIRU|nr:MAG: hypothetical protein H1RhizoLitter1330_000001 [Leviviridae sp.]
MTDGGYVFQERDINTRKSLKGIPEGSVLPNTLPSRMYFPGGTDSFSLGDFPISTRQSTFSYRTRKGEQYPDLISGQAIRSYFLSRGIPSDADDGHDFYTQRTWRTVSHEDVIAKDPVFGWSVRGVLHPRDIPEFPVIPSLDVNYYGNKAISRIAPTAPNANIAQTAAEIIREKGLKLPSNEYSDWLKSRASLAKSAGKGYLNLSFGWIPLISDLVKVVNSLLNINEEIRRYGELSNIETVRRYDFQTTPTNLVTNEGDGRLNFGWLSDNISNSSQYFNGSPVGQLTRIQKESQRIYFKGKFVYSINPGKGIMDKLQAYEQFANKLLGTRITPAVLWELTPWSWLADWFVDVQSAVTTAGLRTEDGLLMHYAYLMRETRMSNAYTVDGLSFRDGPRGPFTISSHIVRKERVRGTPFGFGLNPNSFTERQWAILAALALSKTGYRG